jgi:acyl carrier protein
MMEFAKEINARDERAEEIRTDLNRIALENLKLTPEQIRRIRPDSLLAEVLELDSLAQVIFALEIEDHFGFTFHMEDTGQIKTIEDLIGIVQVRTAGDGKYRS